MMNTNRLSGLRNLGPKSEAMLATIAIRTHEQLAVRGALAAFIALKQFGQPASLNLLYAMEGALSDRDWRDVMRDDKLHLLTELEAHGVTL